MKTKVVIAGQQKKPPSKPEKHLLSIGYNKKNLLFI